MTRQQQVEAALRAMQGGGGLPPDFGQISPAEADLLVVEVLFESLGRLRAWAAEGRRYYALSPIERVGWQFAHPEGTDIPEPRTGSGRRGARGGGARPVRRQVGRGLADSGRLRRVRGAQARRHPGLAMSGRVGGGRRRPRS